MEPFTIKFDKKLWDELRNPRFGLYFNYLTMKNQVMNLTNITEEIEVYQKHFYDSIVLSKIFCLSNKELLDIGAGAGFPSIPLKLIEPVLKVTIVDSLNKRIEFLKELSEKLELKDVTLLHARAEEMDKSKKFDFVTARAVARLNILAELAIPFVKIGGYFIAYKSINYQEELLEAKNCISKLGAKLESVIIYEVNENIQHVLLVIKKETKTPNIYPRSFSKIKKSPL
ncbi:MAG: 16S rRNA (guanine(527)-N(7))-methyltransferase RsmG [Candidatus Izemoplasmatales bacterium]